MKSKIEIKEFNDKGYEGLISFESWKIAMLNYHEELEPLNIGHVQAHTETDESFILLEGKCILFLTDIKDDQITDIQAINMEQHKVYNIKKGVYHTHTLTKDAKVLIVENDNTNEFNSPIHYIDEKTQFEFYNMMSRLWN